MKRLLIFLFSLCPVWMQAQSIDEIRKAMDSYDYELPVRQIEPVSGDSVLAPLRAQALKAMYRYSEALKEWNSLLSSDSASTKVLVELAECYRQIGRNEQSARCYAKAVTLNPENKFFRQKHIRILLASENYEAARDAAYAWLKRDSISATGYKFLGMAYEGLAKEEPDEMINAFFAYNTAYGKDSLDGQTVALIASIFNNNGQFADAVDITETYRMTDSVNVNVNRQNAKAYCMMKDYAKAAERYETLKSLGDRSFATLYYLGMSYYGKNWFYGAQENLMLAHKKNPLNVDLLYYLAKSCVRTSWKKEGLEFMNQAIELALPSDSVKIRLYDGLVDCYNHSYDADPYEKIEAMKKAYSLNKKYTLLYKIAEVYEQQKDYANAIHYYEKYMALVPEEKKVILDEEGKPKTGWRTLYQTAEYRIKELKEESFFRDGVEK